MPKKGLSTLLFGLEVLAPPSSPTHLTQFAELGHEGYELVQTQGTVAVCVKLLNGNEHVVFVGLYVQGPYEHQELLRVDSPVVVLVVVGKDLVEVGELLFSEIGIGILVMFE